MSHRNEKLRAWARINAINGIIESIGANGIMLAIHSSFHGARHLYYYFV